MVLLVLLTAFSVQKVNWIKFDLETINAVNSVKQRYAINFRGSVHDRAISLRDVTLVTSLAGQREPLQEIAELTAAYERSAGPLDAMLTPDLEPTAQESTIITQIKDVERRTLPVIEQVSALARAGQRDAAQQVLLTDAKPLFVEWLARINQFIDHQENANREIQKDLAERTSQFFLLVGLLCLGALGLGGAVAYSIVRALAPIKDVAEEMASLAGEERSAGANANQNELSGMQSAVASMRRAAAERTQLEEQKKQAQAEQELVVKTLGSHLDRLAAGDLTSEISEHFPHDYRQLRMAFNAALKSLGELIRSVAESASEIRTGSSEIAQASEDLARRTESNAASLEETSAAVAQMDGRLKASAGAATATVGRADQAIATVSGGRGLAEEAVQAMGRVSDSAKGIDSVIEGLDKIAFQTRVLAMNAAVEAGRAGEAGRGFAVVADLVSALAMRAEEEAKRARDQLTVTQTDIVTAVEAVGQVDTALQNISADVGEVHQLLGQMANDNQAQALAITEINSAIASMDQSTQQNAAMVEQTSAAARNLMTEVTGLADQAGRFRCEGGKPAAAIAPPPPAAAAAARSTRLPKRGKEGSYQSPVKPLPLSAVGALAGAGGDDWKEF
jgi:methyl-accepting chemotaxis protein